MNTTITVREDSSTTTANSAIRPFQKINIPEAELTELRRRIKNTRWPERETVTDATQGVQLATTQALARYWATEYDWRKIEAKLNALPQFITEIDGLDIHFIHVRSKHENALPLIVTHGWPGSITEQMKIIDPLTNPTAHGGNASDAFDIVVPSMPGYGFSGKPTTTGWGPERIASPPINIFVPATIVELGALMTDLEADPSVKVVVFQSANPDFFIAHLDVFKAAERPEALGLWREFVLRLASSAVVSIAKIRGRTRGIGNEFLLACDMRFASRENALFGQPEVGVGLVPGGGALEWLPRLVGRSRALEFVLSADDFNADIAEAYGWVNRTLDDSDLDAFVDTLVRRLASFERETLGAAKAQINRFGMPTAAELQSSNEMIFPMLALPDAQARGPKQRGIGYGIPSDFELNFGRYLPAFGRTDDDATEQER